MRAASCPHCGGRVMPYHRYAFHMRRGASCAACGRPVRVRAYITAIVVGLLIGITIIPVLLALELDPGPMMLMLGATGLVAVAADYSFWRWVGFEAVPHEDVPSTDAAEPQRETISSS